MLEDFILVKGAISREEVSIYADTMRATLAGGSAQVDWSQVVGSTIEYGSPLMSVLSRKVKPILEKETGLQLCPTYNFTRLYTSGMSLDRHTDRPSCEISATVCLDYDADYRWPIFCKDRYGKEHSIEMEVGDMVIYRGCDVEHWREKFKGSWHLQTFIHYVDKSGPYYPQHAYDSRELPKIYHKIEAKYGK